MFWFIIAQLFSTLLQWTRLAKTSDQEKDLEILLLRRQLAILQRKIDTPIRISWTEKLTLATLAARYKLVTGRSIRQLEAVIRIFQPQTIFKWHRALVRRKWTYRQKNRGGRPRIEKHLEQLIVRLARENSDWGHGKIQGECRKLGHEVSTQTIANILRRHGIPPAPERSRSPSWRHLLSHYKDQILACDFFTIETLLLRTFYLLFFIELGSRRVHFAGCTRHPNTTWVTQQARQVVWELQAREPPIRFLIRDNDQKFTQSFDSVFQSEGIRVITTPFQAPNANAHAERWVRTVREECLDKILIANQPHLHRTMLEFTQYYNQARPHQGINQQIPIPVPLSSEAKGRVCCRDVVGGIIQDYYRQPAQAGIAPG